MEMNLELLVGGTIAIDHVKTPEAAASDLLGGSAAYTALAASYSQQPVHLLGIIGRDFPQPHLEMLSRHGVSLDAVEKSEQESFTWTGEYHENMNDRTTHAVGLNVLERWDVKVPSQVANAQMIVLANMSPDNQMQLLDQVTAEEFFVVADTMDLWVEIARDRLLQVMQRVDLFVINDSEAKAFAGKTNLVQAGEWLLSLGPKFVVIKLGEHGSLLFARGEGASWKPTVETFFRAPAYPLSRVVDPTGAGDSFLGGLAGQLATLGKLEFLFSEVKSAVIRGTALGSFACESFSTKRLEGLNEEAILQRMCELRDFSQW